MNGRTARRQTKRAQLLLCAHLCIAPTRNAVHPWCPIHGIGSDVADAFGSGGAPVVAALLTFAADVGKGGG